MSMLNYTGIVENAALCSGEGGKFFICVGEKTGRLEIFLKINKRGGSNNSGQGGKFPEN